MIDKDYIDITDAKELCIKKKVSYKGLYGYLFDIGIAAEVALYMHKIAANSSKSARWGYLYYGCTHSNAFVELSIDEFWRLWQSVFTDLPITHTAFQNGAYLVKKAFQRKNTPKDNGTFEEIRRAADKITNNINSLLSEHRTG